MSYLQRFLLYRPLRHERATAAMRMDNAGRIGDLVVYEHRERVVTVVICAQTIRDTCHSVAANGISWGLGTVVTGPDAGSSYDLP